MRKVALQRKTGETEIELALNLDGSGKADINTGVAFLDHMLTLFAFHGSFDLEISATGDLEVEDHHTVEDVGIVLGQALEQALAKDQGFIRYGSFMLPMDEVLARVVLDASGRAFLHFHAEFKREMLGTLATENVEEFFRALVRESKMTLHIDILTGGNDHHQVEAIFKGFGRALRQAVVLDPDIEIASTKGVL
jgi:imidazoleglycerol-phosphate dehydratase